MAVENSGEIVIVDMVIGVTGDAIVIVTEIVDIKITAKTSLWRIKFTQGSNITNSLKNKYQSSTKSDKQINNKTWRYFLSPKSKFL